MSGGHFDYAYLQPEMFADDLEKDILRNDDELGDPPLWSFKYGYGQETIAKLTEIMKMARLVSKLMKEAEWLYSGDTGEESFARRVAEIENPPLLTGEEPTS